MNSGPFPVQDRELGGATPALVRPDRSSASPEQCSSPKHHVLLPFPEHVTPESTMESCSASQWQESNWHFTSELTERGEQERLTSDKKQSRFPGSAMRCHTDILKRCTVAKTLPQRPFWGRVGFSRMQNSINFLDKDAQALISIPRALKGEGLDGFGNHGAYQQLEMKSVNSTHFFSFSLPQHPEVI